MIDIYKPKVCPICNSEIHTKENEGDTFYYCKKSYDLIDQPFVRPFHFIRSKMNASHFYSYEIIGSGNKARVISTDFIDEQKFALVTNSRDKHYSFLSAKVNKNSTGQYYFSFNIINDKISKTDNDVSLLSRLVKMNNFS